MYNNILVPVIFDKDHDTTGAFGVARKLASEGAKFTVLHVIEPLPVYLENQLPSEYLKASETEVQERLPEAAAGLPGAEIHLLHGHPGRTIAAYAKENGIDCLVMASHKHGVGDYFVGSTADWVVRHVNCCVHVIR